MIFLNLVAMVWVENEGNFFFFFFFKEDQGQGGAVVEKMDKEKAG